MAVKCPRCSATQQSDAWICTSCGFNLGLHQQESGRKLPEVTGSTPNQGGSGGWEPLSFSSADRDRGHYNAPRLGATPPRRPSRPWIDRPVPTRVHSYMWEAVFVTLCCCTPLGILGIINAARATGLAQAGDGMGAERAAEWARNCVLIGVVLGVVLNAIRLYYFDGST